MKKKIIIKQFRYASDNLSYLVHGRKTALVIDGGAVESIQSYIHKHRLSLNYITNTHAHPDHTSGNRSLKNTAAHFLETRALVKQKSIEIEGEKIKIYQTPGHTNDSITFHIDGHLITGDTLFNGTVGNCFSGDLLSFYKSIKFLMAFSPETIIYAGHDYVKDSMAFAKTMEPDNLDVDQYLDQYNLKHVYSTLADEVKINPYLRFNEKKIIQLLERRRLPVDTEYKRWCGIMSIG